ncbi:MAG TPA: TonB-dependent receptor, partial [Hellea balneolensis]|nr:TonB-dependent receptor [Hellea balneolensis]
PFPSDTGNEYYTTQYTQELRLASNGDEAFNWQIGGFYFNSKMKALTDPGFVAPSIIVDHKEAWAFFGQASYDLSDRTTLTGGLRYTDDSADLTVLNNPSTVVVPVVKASSGEISGDIALNHEMNDNVNIYARFARGFRGPSIQGRNAAFNTNNNAQLAELVSTADSEIIHSFELGFKSLSMENRLRFNAAAFYYIVNDQQFTAVGGGGNFARLVNADKGVGYGFEADAIWAVTDNLNLTAGFALNKTEIKDNQLSVSGCGSANFLFIPGSGSSNCTVTDPLDGNGRALIDGNPFPNAPEITANMAIDYHAPITDNIDFIFSADGSIQGKTNLFLYESREFNTSGNFELGGKMGFSLDDDKYEIAVFARNLTDEVNLAGGIDFNNNTGFVTEPRIVGISFRATN